MEKTFDFNTIGKRMPYTVPDDFFADMEKNVMQEVTGESAVEMSQKSLPNTDEQTPRNSKKAIRIAIRTMLAAAAAVALFFVVQPMLTKNEVISADDFASVELAFNNLSSDDQDFLIAVYENEEYINDLTDTEDYE